MLATVVNLLRPLSQLLQRVSRVCGALAGRARLLSAGVELGHGVKVMGRPVVSRVDGSTLRVGHGVVLCSRSDGTALGVAHPVVLRTLSQGALLDIGDDTGLSGVTVCAAVSVRIGRRCLLGADALIVDTDFHAREPIGRRHHATGASIPAAPVVIGDDVFIGARACILKGVTVGDGAIVGCAAVVTRDVPAGAVVAGNPAVVVGTVDAAAGSAKHPVAARLTQTAGER